MAVEIQEEEVLARRRSDPRRRESWKFCTPHGVIEFQYFCNIARAVRHVGLHLGLTRRTC
jgi:hypothetical protein